MHRLMTSVPTLVVAAATALVGLSAVSWAQTPGPSDAGPVDPPDALYYTGSQPNDPEIERGLPVAQHHRAFLPVSVDLSSRMPAVGNQGRLGSCTSWATAYAARSYYTGALERRDIQQATNLPSPNYVFHLSRRGTCDDGSSFGDAVKVLIQGALSLADYPYSDACVAPAPAQSVARAHDFRVRGLVRVDVGEPDDAKGQLARSNPVLIRFHDSTAFHKLRGPQTFTESAPPAGDKVTGFHAMTLVGYDDRRQAFRLINSWGPGWGDHGFAWISYDLLKSRITNAYALDVGPVRPDPVVNPPPPPPPQPPPAPPVVVQPPPQPTPPPPVVQLPPPVIKPTPPPPSPTPPPPPSPPPAPPPTPTPPGAHPGVALVVGNSGYAAGRLATAMADADVVTETMRAAGYRVTELYDTRKAEIGEAVRSFVNQVAASGPETLAFFYFAGYAAQAAGVNYLVPVDTSIAGLADVPQQAFRLDDLVAELAKVPAAARIIVLEAAHEHGYGRGTPDLVPPGLAAIAAPGGTTIAFAAAPGRIAEQNAGPYSLYTATLVRQMRQSGVELDQAFENARREVSQISQGSQMPWTAGNVPFKVALFPTPSPQPPPVTPPPAPPPVIPAPPAPPPAPPAPITGLQLADLQTLACGRVTVEARGDQSVLSGYVATEADLNRVKLIAASVPKTSLGNVFVAPWPQCEALQTLEKPLQVAQRPAIDIGQSSDLHSGELLKIQVRSPAQISYLYVSYIQADGSVVHLVQPNGLVPQPTLPNQTLEFGSGTDGKPKFTVGPPFGREMIIAIASRSPLFEHALPAQQTERDYLSELRRALIYKPVPDLPDRELAAAMTTLQTSAR